MPASSSNGENPGVHEAEKHLGEKSTKLKDRLRSLYDWSRPLLSINLAWFLLSLPVVTVFPALGGLYHAVLAFSREEAPSWKTVWDGFKQHWWLSVKWGLAILVGYAVFGGAWWYLNTVQEDWAAYASAAAGAVIFLWTAINQFSFSLLMLQHEPKVWIAIRNGYVLVIRHPLNALKTLLLTALVAVLSTLLAPAWAFISMALITHLQTQAVLAAVAKIRAQDAEKDAADAHQQDRLIEKRAEVEKEDPEI